MKSTALTTKHEALGAKMAPFAGYNMPISYSSITEEHRTVREGVGIFDVSHMGEFIVRGREALQLLQLVTSNDVAKLGIGQAQYAYLPNPQGGIIDDLLVYRLPEDNCAEGERAYMLVVNAANIEKDWNWINAQNQFDTKLINISEATGLLAIQGPKAIAVLQQLTTIPLANIKYYHFVKGVFAGLDNILISATGYTGAGGFEIYADNDKLSQLWDTILEIGQSEGLRPIGLGARDTLRLEMGYCLYGNDINDNTSPLEAGLGWITKLDKTNFVGKASILAKKEAGLERKLVGFALEDRRVPRHGYLIEDATGNPIGEVTSGTQSPTLGHPIGLGYVAMAHAAIGTPIWINANGKRLEAQVKKFPFVG